MSGRESKPEAQVTEFLAAWGRGDNHALEQLMPLVFVELRKIARKYMSQERRGHTLQPTALINEAYLRLVDMRPPVWQDSTRDSSSIPCAGREASRTAS